MKAFQWKRLCAAFAALMLGVFCSACSQPSAPVTGSELEALRAEYPYVEGNPFASVMGVEDLKEFQRDERFAGFVEVTLTGEPERISLSLSPAAGLPATTIINYTIPAHVDSVLYKTDCFAGESDILLCISGAAEGYDLSPFKKNSKFVMEISVPHPDTVEASLESAYSVSSLKSFYLTNQNVLLSMQDIPGAFEDYTGWNIDAFRRELKKKLS